MSCRAVAAVLFLVGCPGELDEEALGGPDYCLRVTERIFQYRCVFGCHGAESAQEGLDLESEPVGQRLLGVESLECGGFYVTPTNPLNSLIYQKVRPAPTCGDRMPLYDDPLRDDEIDCVLEWIARQ